MSKKRGSYHKLWLAKLGRQEIDNVFDPSLGIDKMINYYLSKGYSIEWIEARIKAIINRKKLVKTWEDSGIKEQQEYAILTNEIYKTRSGMTALEYKKFKNIRKESLRDNMTDLEVALTDLGEIATRELVRKKNPVTFKEHENLAHLGGNVSNIARYEIEKNLGESVVSKENKLNYNHNTKQIENKEN